MTFLARANIFSATERVFDWDWVADVNRGTTAQHPQEKDQQPRDATTGKAATCKKSGGTKGTDQQKWTGGNRTTDKHNYTHPWLLTSLKGHTGQVYDMDFSSNGKYLASCADGEYALSLITLLILIFIIYPYLLCCYLTQYLSVSLRSVPTCPVYLSVCFSLFCNIIIALICLIYYCSWWCVQCKNNKLCCGVSCS